MKKQIPLILGFVAMAAIIGTAAWYKLYRKPVPVVEPQAETISESDQLHAEANRQFRRKEYSAAGATYTRIIDLEPKDKAAFLGRANARLAQMRYDEALLDYDSAVAIDPGYADAYFARGTMRWLLGDLALAEWDYSTTIQLEPNENFFYAHLAKILYEEKAADRVKVLYREAYRKDSHRRWALDGWFGAMLTVKQYDEILEEYAKILDDYGLGSVDHKNLVAPGFYAGVVYMERKDYEHAIEVLERSIKHAPEEISIEAYGHLANAYRETTKVEECKKRLKEYNDRTGRETPLEWCEGGKT